MRNDLVITVGSPKSLTRILDKQLSNQILTRPTAASLIKSHISSLYALLKILLAIAVEWHSSDLSHLVEEHAERPPIRGSCWWTQFTIWKQPLWTHVL